MNLYLKYQKYHWKFWLSTLLFALFFGPTAIAFSFCFITLAYFYDRHRAETALEKENRHKEVIDAIQSTKTSNIPGEKNPDLSKELKAPWGIS